MGAPCGDSSCLWDVSQGPVAVSKNGALEPPHERMGPASKDSPTWADPGAGQVLVLDVSVWKGAFSLPWIVKRPVNRQVPTLKNTQLGWEERVYTAGKWTVAVLKQCLMCRGAV